ncbi:MAG: GNVR domain-containing protein, partial [Deltaproteobacteria bacterium]|nr:GNVR domain-containing protein [Deltaproteobacteria bacterium]
KKQASPGNKDAGTAVNSLRNPAVASELASVKSQIANLRQRESAVRRQITDYEKRIEVAPRNEQRESDLKRDYEMSLANYRGLLEKKMSAKLAENLEKRQKGARFRVIDPANRPISPTWPNKLMVTLLGLLSGGTVGTGLVFLSEIMNPAFRKPEDFDGVLSHPVLTSIPVFPYSAKKQARKLTVIKGRK